jgi:hypothetical protein
MEEIRQRFHKSPEQINPVFFFRDLRPVCAARANFLPMFMTESAGVQDFYRAKTAKNAKVISQF